MFKINSAKFNIVFVLFLFFAYNGIFIGKLWNIAPSTAFFCGILSVVLVLLYLGANLLFWPRADKFLAAAFLLFNTICLYFMQSFSVVIDKIMLLNVIQTDAAEASDLLNLRFLCYILVGAVLPIALLSQTRIIYAPLKKEAVRRLVIILSGLAFICAVIFPNYKTAAQFLRNNRHLRYSLLPINYVGAVISTVKILKKRNHPFVPTAEDARRLPAASAKKTLIVFIVGETARAQNFSLGGYSRPTNRPLEKFAADIYYFTDASACGTATAISVPCMFSPYGQKKFKAGSEAYTENALDILKRTGYSVLWRENNSGCKNVCDRVETEKFCPNYGCKDEIMLKDLTDKIRNYRNDAVIVLHQQASHGPSYYRRYPAEFEQFKPACKTGQLDRCRREEIINAYDNSILYTSEMIAQTIEELQKLAAEYNIVLFYVSDHGESLGENGIYLHSAPYLLAPETQIKVPFLLWLESETARELKISLPCLKSKLSAPVSHDNIFHTLLGLGGIQTSAYQKELDILSDCRR